MTDEKGRDAIVKAGGLGTPSINRAVDSARLDELIKMWNSGADTVGNLPAVQQASEMASLHGKQVALYICTCGDCRAPVQANVVGKPPSLECMNNLHIMGVVAPDGVMAHVQIQKRYTKWG